MNLRYNLIVIFHISHGAVWFRCVISQLNEATALIIHCPFSSANVLIGGRATCPQLNLPHRRLHVWHALIFTLKVLKQEVSLQDAADHRLTESKWRLFFTVQTYTCVTLLIKQTWSWASMVQSEVMVTSLPCVHTSQQLLSHFFL